MGHHVGSEPGADLLAVGRLAHERDLVDAVDGAPVVREEPEDVEVLLVPGRYAPLPIFSQFEPERRESTIFDKDLRKHIFFVCDVVADGLPTAVQI